MLYCDFPYITKKQVLPIQSEQHLKEGGFHSKMEGGWKNMVKSRFSEKRAINKSCKFAYLYGMPIWYAGREAAKKVFFFSRNKKS